MDMLTAFLMVAGGIALLWIGGEALVASTVALAKWFRVPVFIIGLTFVAFGTSVPELTVALQAGLGGQPAIAIGNVIGSNIANILLVLGVIALIHPIAGGAAKLQRDRVVMLLVSLGFILIALWGDISPLLAASLLGVLGIYVFYICRDEKNKTSQQNQPNQQAGQPAEDDEDMQEITASWLKGGVLVAFPVLAVSIALVVVGAGLLVDGAVYLARGFGISEAIIGLSLVAFGTSLPELAVSMLAALRGHVNVAIGNILGSNISNILLILGVTGLVAPLPVAAHFVNFDIWVMLAAALVAFYSLRGGSISRRMGGVWVLSYAAYIAILYVL